MSKRLNRFVRLFLILFAVSVSVTVLPSSTIAVQGLFGEIKSSTIVEDKEQEAAQIKEVQQEKVRNTKGINFINIWFVLLTTIIYITYLSYNSRLPRGDTIITLKVRMDN